MEGGRMKEEEGRMMENGGWRINGGWKMEVEEEYERWMEDER